jgi:hypothetical protein
MTVGARAVIEHLVEGDKDGARETSGQHLATRLRSPVLARRAQPIIAPSERAAFGRPVLLSRLRSVRSGLS